MHVKNSDAGVENSDAGVEARQARHALESCALIQTAEKKKNVSTSRMAGKERQISISQGSVPQNRESD
jgi:hypothetical protein